MTEKDLVAARDHYALLAIREDRARENGCSTGVDPDEMWDRAKKAAASLRGLRKAGQ